MALLKIIKAIADLGVGVLHSPTSGDPAAPNDGKDVRKDKHSFGLGLPLSLSAGVALGGLGGLWIGQAAGTVKIGFDLDKGFVLEITKVQRPIVEELESMGYPDNTAAQVRQVRSNGKGPWNYPRLVLAAKTRADIPRHQAAVCRNSELEGERLVLANTADGPEASLAVYVSASRILLSCTTADSNDKFILLGAEDMKALTGGKAAREIGVYVSVLAKDPTSPLANPPVNPDIGLVGSADQPDPPPSTGDDT
jgi:hypothetical protein